MLPLVFPMTRNVKAECTEMGRERRTSQGLGGNRNPEQEGEGAPEMCPMETLKDELGATQNQSDLDIWGRGSSKAFLRN